MEFIHSIRRLLPRLEERVMFTNLVGLLALPLLAYLIFLAVNANRYVLELPLQSDRSTLVRLEMDRGNGSDDAQSATLNNTDSRSYSEVRCEFGAGRIVELRLHLDRTAGRVRVGDAILRSQGDEILGDDHILATFRASQIRAVSNRCVVTRLDGGKGVQLELNPADADAVFIFNLPHPMTLGFNVRVFIEGALMAVLLYVGLILAGLMGWRRLAQVKSVRRQLQQGRAVLERGYASAGFFVQRQPAAAIWLMALAGMLLSCYPIVFCGRSFVSPNFGSEMLYAGYPTLPGFPSKAASNPQGSDIGATMWGCIPYAAIQHRAIFHDHEIPFWNRYADGGVPLLGQGQTMLGDPLHWIVILGGANASAWDLKYLIAKLLFAAGVGWMVRTATGHRPTALVLGFSSCFLGFFTYRFDHPAFFSVAYAPWIVFAWLEIARAGTIPRWVGLLLLANWCEMNSGTVKEAYMLLLGLNGLGLLTLLLSATLSWRRVVKALLVLTWVGVCFSLIAAPVWCTFLDTMVHSWSEYNSPYAFQLQPGMFVGLFDDIFYRQFNYYERTLDPSMNFVILLGVALSIGAAKTLAQRERTWIAASVAGAVFGMLAFGVIPPSFIKSVPFLGNVAHCDNTFSNLLMISLFIIAGHGLAHSWRRFEANDWAWDVVAAGAILFLLISAFLGMSQAAQRSDIHFLALDQEVTKSAFFWMDAAALSASFLVLPFVARRFCLDHGATAVGMAPWLVLCLGAMLWRQGSHLPLWAGLERYTMQPPQRGDFFALSNAIEFLNARQNAEPGRVQGLGDNLIPGVGGIFGVEMPSGPDALQNAAYHRLLVESGLPLIWKWRLVLDGHGAGIEDVRRFYDLLNVRYYVATPGEADIPGLRRVGHFDLDIFESETAWPRAFFTDEIEVCRGTVGLLTRTIQGDGRPFAAIEPDELSARPELAALGSREEAGDRRLVVPAYDYHLTNNTSSFLVHAPGAGIVAIMEGCDDTETEVMVNARSVAHFRVDGAFTGIYLDQAGDYAVSIRYRPRRWITLVSLCGMGVILLVGTCLWAIRNRLKHVIGATTAFSVKQDRENRRL